MMSASTLAAQAAQGSQAWSTLDALFQAWTAATASPSIPTPGWSEPAIRAAYASLHALRLDALFLSHIVRDVLQAWVEQTLVAQWWTQLDPFSSTQLALFGTPAAPRRFHSQLNEWVLQAVTTAVRQAHDSIQPLVERIAAFDHMLHSCGSSEALGPQFQRLIRTAFDASLSKCCAAGSDPEPSTSLPHRSSMLHELLFKYYRLNFRAFHRCSASAAAMNSSQGGQGAEELQQDATMDETMEATEREAQEMQDGMANEQKQSRQLSPAEILDQFTTTSSLLLSMHFLGAAAGDVVHSSPSSVHLQSYLLPVSSWLAPSHFLDFFYILIEKYLRATVKGEWEQRKLGMLAKWMDERVKPFLQIILTGRQPTPLSSGLPSHTSASLVHWSTRLDFYSQECFGLMRIREELFDMIKDYPDSQPALEDLKDILAVTKQHDFLVEELARVFRKRLLQPGTNTRSILEQYAHTIACCRHLDPSSQHSLLGGILSRSGIGEYVRERKDARRCVVRAVWGAMEERAKQAERDELDADAAEEQKQSSDLSLSNLSSASAADLQESAEPMSEDAVQGGLDLLTELETVPDATQFGDDSDAELTAEEAEVASSTWQPDPISGEVLAGSGGTAGTRYLAKADVLSLLIDLCGNGERNEELLLSDYKSFLSSRLLSKRSARPQRQGRRAAADVNEKTQDVKDPLYDTEVEVTHLELMKLRFGDTNPSLLDVEVMLRDVTNSKRIRNQVEKPTPGSGSEESMLVQALQERREAMIQSEDQEDESDPIPSAASHAASLAMAPQFNALLLSSEFWPDLADGDDDDLSFTLPSSLHSLLASYSSLYHQLKTPRELEFLPALPMHKGNVVRVEMTMRDGRVERLECEPIHVAIIEKFAEPDTASQEDADNEEMKSEEQQARTEWSLDDLAAALGIDAPSSLQPKLQFWLQLGFLRSTSRGDAPPVYALMEDRVAREDEDDGVGGGEADATVPGQWSEKQRREQDAQVESYVLGSLGNFASLTVDKLHSMMKTISTSVSGFLYTKSEGELRILLTGMTQRGLLKQDGQSFATATKLQQQS